MCKKIIILFWMLLFITSYQPLILANSLQNPENGRPEETQSNFPKDLKKSALIVLKTSCDFFSGVGTDADIQARLPAEGPSEPIEGSPEEDSGFTNWVTLDDPNDFNDRERCDENYYKVTFAYKVNPSGLTGLRLRTNSENPGSPWKLSTAEVAIPNQGKKTVIWNKWLGNKKNKGKWCEYDAFSNGSLNCG
jgi:hypothetical protein